MKVLHSRNKGKHSVTEEYCSRFGQVAVEKGFITKEQLKEALSEQVDDDLANRRHRLIGTILFERDWLTVQQIDIILDEMSQQSTYTSPE